jgi:serine protease
MSGQPFTAPQGWSALWVAAVMALAGCGGSGGDSGGGGGGGGGEVAPEPVTAYTLSGTISIAPTAAVDSDLNDPNQAPYAVNDHPDTAQPLTTPVLLNGTVNVRGTGPAGNNFAPGDADDYFRVNLVAGQVVELEFATDPAQSDVDLYLWSADGQRIVGRSEGVDSRFECVQVSTSGAYVVNVYAYKGASIYNLRIGAPGSGSTCATRTTAANFNPGELLALARPVGAGTTAQALAASRTLQQSAGLDAHGADQPGPHLLQLPVGAQARARGLAVLAGHTPAEGRARSLGASTTASASAEPPELVALKYAKRLRESGAYVYVQPNWVMQPTALLGPYPPNDRNYSYQRWHYEQINLPAAMARLTALANPPAQRPLVAVIDDGVVLNHPDLAPQLFSAGRTFASVNAVGDNDSASGDNPQTPADQPIFHGTHVAGTIAAATFDDLGGAGVAPMAQILPLRVILPRGALTVDIVQAMLYAAGLPNRSGLVPARRADVINLSLGGDRSCDAAYLDVIGRVRAAGVIVVAAAGNSGNSQPVGTPANCAGAIAVGATNAQRQLTAYSQTGSPLAVAAPGGDTSQSTTGNGAPDGVYSDLATFDSAGRRQASFGPLQGTSMAAPHVAGVLALMRYLNPALTPAQIDTLLSQGALTDDLGAAGRDTRFGWGLINARKAVDTALASVGTPPPATGGQVVASPATLDVGSFQSSATLTLQASSSTAERVVSVTSDHPAVTVQATSIDTTTRLGTYTLTIDRSRYPTAGTYYPRLTVTLSPARSFTVQLTVVKTASGSASATANFGPVYVLLIDPDTGAVVTDVLATWSGGRYTWRFDGWERPRLQVLAGGDLDNDTLVCQRGEPCGAYPLLSSSGDASVITLTGPRSDLDFEVAPLSGMSPQSLSAGTAPATPVNHRRTH